MYSSSFNPIFNSLNNKYLTLPGFLGLGKSTAQIKILKNNSSNDPLSLTELTVKKDSATRRNNLERSGTDRSMMTVLHSSASRKATLNKGMSGESKPIRDGVVANPSPLIPALKGESIATPKPLLKGATQPARIRMHTANTKANSVALASSLLSSYAKQRYEGEPSNLTSYIASPHLTDNKKFLFLYFIVPIFFATLKNSIAGVYSSALHLRTAQPSISAEKVSVAMQEDKPTKAKKNRVTSEPKRTLMVNP